MLSPLQAFVDVSIPARNEEERIDATLRAFARQEDGAGHPIGRERFRVTLLANGCSDRTAGRARSLARTYPSIDLRVVEKHAREIPNVGAARKFLMDRAARAFVANGRHEDIVATTDADTVVASDWIHRTVSEMCGVDAVGGILTLDEDETRGMSRAFQAYYDREIAYREAFARLESLIDPLEHDPWPRHRSFSGASLAVTARAYVACGGVRDIATLEDRELSESLMGMGARIRHSLAVKATTSPRRLSRVSGGFATLLNSLHERGTDGIPHLVEHPMISVARMRDRANARRQGLVPNPSDVGGGESLLAEIPIEEATAILHTFAATVLF